MENVEEYILAEAKKLFMKFGMRSVTMDDIATLSFAGMIKSDVTKLNSTIYYKNITWTPTSDQLGYQVMCAMAFDR